MRVLVACLILTLTFSAVIQLSKQVKHKWLYFIINDSAYRIGCLDEHGGGEAQAYPCNGGNYQKWWLKPTGDGYLYIQSYRSGNYLDSNANGDAYTLPGNGGWFQQWSIEDGHYLKNRATGRYLQRGFWTDTIKTDKSDGDYYLFKDITPEFDCPQMDAYIGNANGKLTFGKGFSNTCWSIEYWKNGNGVTVGAQCWTNDRKSSNWSTMTWNAFAQCL